MRSANLPASVTATTTPDMFKSRRKSHLVLMQDDKDRLGRKGSGSGRSSVVNETKPYAGEGGMKKLLARRKQEAEEEADGQKEKQIEDRGNEDIPRPRQPSPVAAVRVIPDPSIVTGADWFSTAASATSSGSSLRVGRSTNRNHLARPAKSRFSAKYDEEADAEDTEAQRSERRREMAEEAAKLVPLFAEPPGFSFSLEVCSRPIQLLNPLISLFRLLPWNHPRMMTRATSLYPLYRFLSPSHQHRLLKLLLRSRLP